MTPGPFDVDYDLNRWAPENLRSELERALRRAQHVLIVGRLGSGRTRAARLACQLLVNAGESANVVHLIDGVDAEPQGRTIFVGHPGVRISDLPDASSTVLVTVHPWERDELRITLARAGVDRGLADRLYAHTGGHLVFLRAWDAAGRPEDLSAPETWQSPVDRALDALSPEARALAEELSCGYGVLAEPPAPTLAQAAGDPSTLLAELDEVALLDVGGELLPVARGTVDRRLPPYRRQWLRRRFLADLTDPIRHQDLLIRWARSGQSDQHLSRHLTTCADRIRFSDPALAVELYEIASTHSPDEPETQAGLAESALVLGDHARALRAAEPALAAPGPTRFRGLRVIQEVWSGKGMPARAATLNSRYAEHASLLQAATSFLTHARIGDLAAAEQAWAARPEGVATTVDEIAVVALIDTVHTSVSTGEADHTDLDRLAELGRDISAACRNMTGWVSVTASLAIAAGHAEAARSLLRHLSGQADFTGEHHLLLAWTELQAGHLTEAVDHLALARTLPLTPRDELLGCGLDLALAQRRHDRATLAGTWPGALAAAVRCEPDLFGITVYPDLIVAAARLREGPALDQVWTGAQTLLTRLGHPPVWSNLLDWARIQAAILTSDKDQLREPAQRLARAANRSPQAAVLASAGRVWIDVLAKSFDPHAAIAAARSLATVGLPGDGARLSSHAAARCDDPAVRRDLLDTARLLNPGSTGNSGVNAPPTSLRLSDREIQVAELVVRHRSYREIGEALFLSPRTVENHVARIRRRSGAGSRRELIDQLRQTLRELGQLG